MNASPEQAGPEVGGRFQVPVDGALFNGIRAREIKEGWGISETAPSDEAYADLREDGGTFADRLENDIAATQAALERMERQQPSDTMPKDNLVYENRPISLKLFTSADLAEAGAGAAINPQSYRESGKRAQEELRKEAAEPHLSTRIKNLKSALAEAEGNQEEFRTKALQEELDKAREELQAIYLKRTKDIERGVAALEAQDAAFEEASRPDPEKIGKDWSGMLQRLNGQEVPSEPATPVEPVEPAAPSEPSKPHVPGAADESAPGVLTEDRLVRMNNEEWRDAIYRQVVDRAQMQKLEITAEHRAAAAKVMGAVMEGPLQKTLEEFQTVVEQLVGIIEGQKQETEAASEPTAPVEPTEPQDAVLGPRDPAPSRGEAPEPEEPGSEFEFIPADSPETAGNKLVIRSAVAERPKTPERESEDTYIKLDQNGFYAVIDGMGGMGHGREAAQAIAKGVQESVQSALHDGPTRSIESARALLKSAFEKGMQSLEAASLGKAGATIAAVATVEQADGTYLAFRSAGDTMIYLYRDGNVTRINEEQIVEDRPNIVKNAISYEWNGSEDDYGEFQIYPGDKILVCSDGITGDWPKERLTDVERAEGLRQRTPGEAAQWLVEHSKKIDDRTALVLFVGADGSVRNAPAEPPAPDHTNPGASGSNGEKTDSSTQETTTPPKEAKPTVVSYRLEHGGSVSGSVRWQIQRLKSKSQRPIIALEEDEGALDSFVEQRIRQVMQLNDWKDDRKTAENLPPGQTIKLLSDEEMLKAAWDFLEQYHNKQRATRDA